MLCGVNVQCSTLMLSAGTMQITAGGGTLGTSIVNNLSIAGGGSPTAKLDLNDHSLAVDYTGTSPLGTPFTSGSIANLITTAYADGSWSGNGITTSLGDSATHALGYGEASTVFGISGSGTATFDGQTVDATSALVKYTYYGDANLDGKVDSSDYAILSDNYGESGKIWTDGDFNYDGTVDDTDAALLEDNYGDGDDAMMADTSDPPMEQLYHLLLDDPTMLAIFRDDPTLWAPLAPYADGGPSPDAVAGSVVPEPASLAILVGAFSALMIRRRRKVFQGGL